jgi:hypothetical protein
MSNNNNEIIYIEKNNIKIVTDTDRETKPNTEEVEINLDNENDVSIVNDSKIIYISEENVVLAGDNEIPNNHIYENENYYVANQNYYIVIRIFNRELHILRTCFSFCIGFVLLWLFIFFYIFLPSCYTGQIQRPIQSSANSSIYSPYNPQ